MAGLKVPQMRSDHEEHPRPRTLVGRRSEGGSNARESGVREAGLRTALETRAAALSGRSRNCICKALLWSTYNLSHFI